MLVGYQRHVVNTKEIENEIDADLASIVGCVHRWL